MKSKTLDKGIRAFVTVGKKAYWWPPFSDMDDNAKPIIVAQGDNRKQCMEILKEEIKDAYR